MKRTKYLAPPMRGCLHWSVDIAMYQFENTRSPRTAIFWKFVLMLFAINTFFTGIQMMNSYPSQNHEQGCSL